MIILYRGDQCTDMSELEAVESRDVVGLYPLRPAKDGTPRTIINLRNGEQRVACLSVEHIAKATGKVMCYVSDEQKDV